MGAVVGKVERRCDMRLINADSLIEDFDPEHYFDWYTPSIIETINKQPTVELSVRGKWIPCSERLPEGCKEAELEVLISTKEIYPDAYFNEAGFALYYPETKTFHSVYGDRLDITEIVIAWQYLPEPFSADREKVTE